MILYNEWVCDEWWFTCSHYLDSVQDAATALYVAAQNGHCEAVRMLLMAGADVNMKTNVSRGVCVLCWFHGWVQRIVKLQRTLIAFQSSILSLVPPTTSNHIEVNKGFEVPKEELDDRNAIKFLWTQILIQTFWPCLSSSGLSVCVYWCMRLCHMWL